jgi:hypothetical protein
LARVKAVYFRQINFGLILRGTEMRKLIGVAILIGGLCLLPALGGGCNSDKWNKLGYNERGEYNSLYDQYKPTTYTTKVVSDPPGARIELDNNYIGNAPLEIQWVGWPKDRHLRDNHTVKALPIHEGQYVQVKSFRGTAGTVRNSESSLVPDTILFDMNLAPAP